MCNPCPRTLLLPISPTVQFTCGRAGEREPGRQVECAVRRSIIVGWLFHLEIGLTVYNAHDVAPDPDLSAFRAQMDAAGALEGGALGRDIRRFGKSCADEPLCEARVEAAGDRIFVSAGANERPHLEGRVAAGVMRTDHA